MPDSTQDHLWHRFAKLALRLSPHIRVNRHMYRGETWYLLFDQLTQKSFRLTVPAYQFIGLLDGRRSVAQALSVVTEHYGDKAPAKKEVLLLINDFIQADMLQTREHAKMHDLKESHEKRRSTELFSRFINPMALRVPLVDPDKFLSRWSKLSNPAFSFAGLFIWLGLVISAAFVAFLNWGELTQNLSDRILAPSNILVMMLIFPVLKALHEIGHGLAIKRWGGDVHEMGIMLLVFMPIPYVNAAASTAFKKKSARAVVGAAGMMTEMMIASFAMWLWLLIEPGFIRAILFDVIFIAGISTILFNINPLLRFDGYYILSDITETPNLASRANRYIIYLVQCYVLGLPDPDIRYAGEGERAYLLSYAVASFIYRISVSLAIAAFVIQKFMLLGLLISIWMLVLFIGIPLVNMIRFLLISPRMRHNGSRPIVGSVFAGVVLGALLFLVPLPSITTAEGVVWVPDARLVRAKQTGFVNSLANQGDVVQGMLLVEMQSLELTKEIEVANWAVKELELKYRQMLTRSPGKSRVAQEELKLLRERVAELNMRQANMHIKSRAEGRFSLPVGHQLKGLYVEKGQVLGYVVGAGDVSIRMVVDQQAMDRVRWSTNKIEIRPIYDLDTVYQARLVGETPALKSDLPSAVLATVGGGEIAVDPESKDMIKSFDQYFELELEIAGPHNIAAVGSRVLVRFIHSHETLAEKLYRSMRITFLRLLYV